MTWFRVDDHLHSHRKARRAGLHAMGLWAVAGSYAGAYLTEGFVPDWFVNGWPQGQKLAKKLVDEGLWCDAEVDGETGWIFHQWGEFQPSKEEIEADRKANRERQRAWRAKNRDKGADVTSRVTSHVTDDVTDGVTNGVSNGPLPKPFRSVPNKEQETPSTDVSDFDQFWAAYPKKVDKIAAKKAYAKAIKSGATPEQLAAAATRYAGSVEDPKYTKHPATWLNAGSYLDAENAPRHVRGVEAIDGLKGEERARAIRTAWM